MYLERKIDVELEIWKQLPNRKPLILRGARQVGKSSSVKNLSTKFKYFIEINFDENPTYATIFEKGLDPAGICEQLSVISNTPIIEGETLLFFDEIQSCIPAISSLRYFYEKMPNLHLIAAGSLLEFALSEIPSFGVGRVRSIFMYPLSFEEFLLANKENGLVEALNKATTKTAFPELFHQKLKTYLKKFLIIGGMPEAVKTYISNGDMLEVQRVLDDLILSIQADFVKYKIRVSPARIREVFDAVVKQVGNKFSYSYPNATLNNVQIKEALVLLEMAGLVYFVTHSASNGIPIGAEINSKKRKILLFDTGIFQRIQGLNIAQLLIEDDFNSINKGNIAELLVGLELIKNTSCYEKTHLYYWQREAKNSQAEVDYVIQKQDKIIPIEVKAGTKGSMQSLYLFLEEKKLDFGIRLSLENFSEMEKIKIVPLYAVGNLLTS
ncbi:ATP-binding protein [Flavobacterium franklandianum]|uniref:ATP-binding protein n=1 Tax=Flavobacterium franklandianum TaxID=2594430 RepID=A0A553CQM8_9FLAO|nr:AAA family ATPase [Flavobacterium franklandianum]TRX22846.1 ATP-binding protein [Flavobacterium franklandianum]TRX24416.1 ATP-binding protein [Flavobacterium franklandianum]